MTELIEIRTEAIKPNPRQPRSEFDMEELNSLAQSIREHGILQPLVVTTQTGWAGTYTLVTGERRLRAAILAGKETVPCLVREVSDQEQLELALIENVQRSDLNPLDVAQAYQLLVTEFGLSHIDIAAKVGKARSTVVNALRLLNLPMEQRAALREGRLSERQAMALLALFELPETLRKAAEAGYEAELRPTTIGWQAAAGSSSDTIREAVGKLIGRYARGIIWSTEFDFAVPRGKPSQCGACSCHMMREGKSLCGDPTCFSIRLGAWEKSRLPIQEFKMNGTTVAPVNAEIEYKKVEVVLPEGFAVTTTVKKEENKQDIQDKQDGGTEATVNTIATKPAEWTAAEENLTPAPLPQGEGGEQTIAPVTPAAPAPSAPAALTWAQSTLELLITYMPEDGNEFGRPVMVGLRANNGAPILCMGRERDIFPEVYTGLVPSMFDKLHLKMGD